VTRRSSRKRHQRTAIKKKIDAFSPDAFKVVTRATIKLLPAPMHTSVKEDEGAALDVRCSSKPKRERSSYTDFREVVVLRAERGARRAHIALRRTRPDRQLGRVANP
jgi:hypothetical protein